MVKKKARRRLCTVYCMHTTRSPVWLLGGLLGGTAPAFDYILTNSLHIYHVEPRNFPAPIMPSPATQTTDAGIGRVFRDNFLGGREGGGSIHNKNRPCKVFWIFTFTTTSPPPLSPLLNPLLIHKIYISLAFHDQNAEHSPRAVLSAACCEYVNLQNSNDCGKAIALKTTLVSSSSSMQRGWWFSVNRQTEQ